MDPASKAIGRGPSGAILNAPLKTFIAAPAPGFGPANGKTNEVPNERGAMVALFKACPVSLYRLGSKCLKPSWSAWTAAFSPALVAAAAPQPGRVLAIFF